MKNTSSFRLIIGESLQLECGREDRYSSIWSHPIFSRHSIIVAGFLMENPPFIPPYIGDLFSK